MMSSPYGESFSAIYVWYMGLFRVVVFSKRKMSRYQTKTKHIKQPRETVRIIPVYKIETGMQSFHPMGIQHFSLESSIQMITTHVYTLHSRCVCILASGGTILLLLVYTSRDPDGIKMDSVRYKQTKMASVSSNVVFLTWFHENNEMTLPDVYTIEWCGYFSASTHTNTWNTQSILMFLGVHKIWSAWRGIKTESIFVGVCN